MMQTEDMRIRSIHCLALCALLLQAAIVLCQQLSIQAGNAKPVVLSRTDIEALPRMKVTANTSAGPVTFEGASLKAVLEKAAVGFGETLKGR
ncbi:MAG: hypothetical protein ABSD20_14085, partial [Terriglobales bacterium]